MNKSDRQVIPSNFQDFFWSSWTYLQFLRQFRLQLTNQQVDMKIAVKVTILRRRSWKENIRRSKKLAADLITWKTRQNCRLDLARAQYEVMPSATAPFRAALSRREKIRLFPLSLAHESSFVGKAPRWVANLKHINTGGSGNEYD